MKKTVVSLFLALTLILSVTQVIATEKKVVISNPYENVNWSTFKQYRSNLHTHTTRSDGGNTPDKMIDTYKNKGYDILALTDHDYSITTTTWPWTDFGRNPKELNMIAVQGMEVSNTHHTLSLFCDYGGGTTSEDTALSEIGARGGLAVFAHPGKYKKELEWYLDFYEKYPQLIGIEILNQGNRYKNDRQKWDDLLSVTMPERNIWGFGDDDSHAAHITGRDWEVYVLDELTLDSVKEATQKGQFFVSSTYTIEGPKGDIPYVSAIDVDEEKGEITITGDKYYQITWISQGKVVATGEKINCLTTPGVDKYVRAVLTGVGGETYTQPFGIKFSDLSDSDAVNFAAKSLTFERFCDEESDKVTGNISLPNEWINDTKIEWVSSNPDIIASDGTVARPDEDTMVVLTATISKNAAKEKKCFNVKVLKEPSPNGICAWVYKNSGKVVVEGGYEFAGGNRVTLTAQDSEDNYVYVMQKNRETDNTFRFEFYLDNSKNEEYTLKVGAVGNTAFEQNISMDKYTNNVAVTMLSITDDSGEQVTEFSDNENISINVTLEKNAEDEIDKAALVSVVYDSKGKLIGVYNADYEINSLSENLSLDITLPDLDDSGCYMRLFVWNTLSGIKPIAGCQLINLN